MKSLHQIHGSLCFALVVSLSLAFIVPAAWSQEPTVQQVAPQAEQASSLKISMEDKLVTLNAVNADVRDVMKALADKSGIPIEVFEGVTGKVTLHLEMVPLEAAVDKILAAVGQRNYLMVSGGDGLQKITIVPKGAGGVASEAVKRVKVKGKLRNGKEIEYYPGEIVITIGGKPADMPFLDSLIQTMEEKYNISLLSKAQVTYDTMLIFRILDGRDALKVMYEIRDNPTVMAVGSGTVKVNDAFPNGLGVESVEIPDHDFHVIKPITREELAARNMTEREYKLEKYDFLGWGEVLPGKIPVPYILGEITISVAKTDTQRISYDDILSLANDEGGNILSYFRREGASVSDGYHLLFPKANNFDAYSALIKRLGENPLFKRAQEYWTGPGYQPWGAYNGIPSDEYYQRKLQWNISKIRAEHAWDIASGDSTITVAVIDTGVDIDHEDLQDRLSPLSANCAVVSQGCQVVVGMNNVQDEEGHGTKVAGVAAGITNNEGKGIAGIAGGGFPDLNGAMDGGVRILVLKVAQGDDRSEANAIDYAASKNAKVVNLSWDWMYRQLNFVPDAISDAKAAGIVVVGAADNPPVIGEHELNYANIPAPYTRDLLTNDILIVGASTAADTRRAGTNWGEVIHVYAPGDEIWSTTKDGGYANAGWGTSFAAPHVSGLAALIRSVNSNLTTAQVFDFITGSADFPTVPLENNKGRINAYAALRKAQGVQKDTTPPGKPTDGMLTPGPRHIQVIWTATDNDAIGECFLYRREASGVSCADPEPIGGVNYCMIAEVPGSQASGSHFEYLDAAIVEDTNYLYRIIAVDKTGNRSIPSDELGPAMNDDLAPAKPNDLKTTTGDGKVRLSWGAPTENADNTPLSDLQKFRIRYSTRSATDPNATTIDTDGPAVTQYDLGGLENKIMYIITVTAVDTAGNESEPAMITAIPRGDVVWVNKDPLSGQYASIQAALSAASRGTTIMVGPGDYSEDVLTLGDHAIGYDPAYITLISERGPGETRIIGNNGSAEMVIDAADGCSIIGFSFIKSSTGASAINCMFDTDVLIANNIFISYQIAIYLDGQMHEKHDLPVRIYNNVFSCNGTGIEGYFNLGVVIDVRNNIFRGSDNSIDDYGMNFLWSGFVHAAYNDFYGNTTNFGEDIIVENVFEFAPHFRTFDSSTPETSDYHLQSISEARNAGDSDLEYKGLPWIDCDGTKADLGAYGGPYAYVDNTLDGIPDCQCPTAYIGAAYLYQDQLDQLIVLSARDPQNSALTYSVVEPPGHGELGGTGANLTYTPDSAYTGPDTFTFKTSNGYTESNIAPVNITISNANAPPTVDSQTITMDPDEYMRRIILSGTDPDADQLAFIVDSMPTTVDPPYESKGQLLILHQTECYYFRGHDYVGAERFSFHASDGYSDSPEATITVIVDHPPVITTSYPDEALVSVGEDGSQEFWIDASDEDNRYSDRQTLTYQWKLDNQVVSTVRSYVFNPLPSSGGNAYNLSVQVSDGLLPSLERSWTIVVRRTIVSDDNDPLYFNTTGTWTTASSEPGYLNNGYHICTAGTEPSYAYWNPELSTAGTYKVYARWPANSTYDTDAVFRVTFANGEHDYDDIEVDQTRNGGQWNLLGTYYFDTSKTEIRLKIGSGDVGVADAVRLVATDDPADIIMNNDHPNAVPVGTWNPLSHNKCFYGDCLTAVAGEGNQTFTWTPTLAAPGTYDLYAWWKVMAGGATNAKYVVNYDGVRTSQVTVDQTVSGGHWNQLGTFYFGEGNTPYISVNDNAVPDTTVVADAMKLVFRSPLPSNIVDNDASSTHDQNAIPPDYFEWLGDWQKGTTGPSYYGGGYRWIASGSAGHAIWHLPIAEAGNYELYARWISLTDSTTRAVYDICRNNAPYPDVVVVDQTVGGGEWQYLGRYHFDVAPSYEHSLYLWQSTTGSVVADAIMYQKTDEDLPIIMDNDDHSITKPEHWNVPSPLINGHWGYDYFQNTGTYDAFVWTPQIATGGRYDVSARWTSAPDRDTSAKYTIYHGSGSTEVHKNQRNNGGKWASLGRYYLYPGTAWIMLQPQNISMTTVADAVRLDYTTAPLATIIDNADKVPPNYFVTWKSEYTNDWSPFSSSTSYESNYLLHIGYPWIFARWVPQLTARGYYKVYAWWPAGDSSVATDAPFKIIHAGSPGGEWRYMNQQINGGKWNYLGTFLFDVGENGYVELWGGANGIGANGSVMADAIKFEMEGE